MRLFQVKLLESLHIAPLIFLQFIFCISLSAGIGVSLLCIWHLYLVFTAQTSIDYQINRSNHNLRQRMYNLYNQGSYHANWELVFGPCQYKLYSLLPHTSVYMNERNVGTTEMIV